jgi:molecular chaperone GrpE
MIDEGLNNEIEPEATEIENMEELKQALADEKQKAETNLTGWQRAQADFENYKKRNEQEKIEIGKFANSVLILNLLPIIDDFERAFNSIPSDIADDSWLEGIKLIENKLKAYLMSQGITPIQAVGEPFDPNFHEAVRQDKEKKG